MLKVTARCDEERGCPLYKKDARLEFVLPAVSGVDGVPLCATAVVALAAPAARVAQGEAHERFARTFCGGCAAGKAWWSFRPPEAEAERAVPAGANDFLLKALTKLKVFAGLQPLKLARILRLLSATRFAPAQVVIARGKPGVALYIILEGEFEVVQVDENQSANVLAVLRPGECFGEMALITGEPASADVRARTAATVLAIAKPDFYRMLAFAPEVAITLARILAARLTNTGRWVIDELKKGLIGRLEQITPAELIQAMNVNNQTGMLIVQNGAKNLSVYMHDGQIVEAELGDSRGEEAFYEFLSWVRGNFRFEAIRKDNPVRQVQTDTVGLLLEGMRRVDEFRETGVWRKG